MLNLIDVSDFVGDRNIPNSGNKDVMERINFFIHKFQKICLQQVFGDDLYAAVIAEDPIVSDSRIDKLINGDEDMGWDGMKQVVLDFVYFWYVRDAATLNSGKNMIIPQVDASYNITPAQKLVDAWECFIDGVTDMQLYLNDEENIDIYPEFTVLHSFTLDRMARPINEFDI